MAHKILMKIFKNIYTQTIKNLKKSKELWPYARALVYVAKTMNIISAKFT